MKTHPQPGQTRFQSRLTDDQARRIAHYYYDVVELISVDTYHAVKTIGGYSAMIGNLNGRPFILHKNPDGTRTLQPAVEA
jgi:hypothetical protein